MNLSRSTEAGRDNNLTTEIPMDEFTAKLMLQKAYADLLQMPHGGVRARNQAVFCALRDAIAEECKQEPQVIQDSFEEMALRIRMAA